MSNKDNRGQAYIDVDNVRVTLVPAAMRATAKNWAGKDVIRIAAYVGDGTNRTHRGAEFPIGEGAEERFFEAIRQLCRR